jgi:hypothetical protein
MREIRVKDEYGDILVRDSLVIVFFCRQPFQQIAEPFKRCFEYWSASTPPEAKAWCIIGENAETYRKVTQRQLARALEEFEVVRVKTDESRFLEIGGPQKINPDFRFLFEASQSLQESQTSFLEVRLPASMLGTQGTSWIRQFAQHIAELVPYDSGYASLGLTWGIDSQLVDFPEAVRGFAFRHPGFDVAINDGTAFNIAGKLRGAYWLTFVGQEALAVLGGPKKLRQKLNRRISMAPIGSGWMLQAGEEPEPGDVNRGEYLPLLRSLAKVLEPVMFFNDEALGQLFAVDEDEEDLERWERRFFLREYGDDGEEDSSEDD